MGMTIAERGACLWRWVPDIFLFVNVRTLQILSVDKRCIDYLVLCFFLFFFFLVCFHLRVFFPRKYLPQFELELFFIHLIYSLTNR